MTTSVEIHDTTRLTPKTWTHRKVTSRAIVLTNETDTRVMRVSVGARSGEQNSTPRHRHNFEQVRFAVRGESNYGRITAEAGDCSFFPEGVFYGPEAGSSEDYAGITIQTQGPSWALVPTRDQMNAASEELARSAEVDREQGVVRWPDGRVQDSYEAVWEHITGQPVSYPEPRFGDVVRLRSLNFEWSPAGEIPGVSVKRLACFDAAGPAIQMVRMETGARLPGGASRTHRLAFPTSGEIAYGSETYGFGTVLYYPPGGKHDHVDSTEETTLLVVEYAPRGEVLGMWGW